MFALFPPILHFYSNIQCVPKKCPMCKLELLQILTLKEKLIYFSLKIQSGVRGGCYRAN